jgi:hypothetical protein
VIVTAGLFAAIFLLVPVVVGLTDRNPALARIFRYVGTFFETNLNGFSDLNFGVFALIVILALFFVVSIHELGHVAAGFVVGFHFKSIRVGPLKLAKLSGRLRITFKRISSFDGIALMRVQQLVRVRRKLAFYIAAGPCANLFFGLSIWQFLASHLSDPLRDPTRQFLQVFTFFSVLLAAQNLIPYRRHNGMFTDGARLLSLARSKVKTSRWLSIVALRMQIDSGVRLRDLKRTWIAHSCAIVDQSQDALQAFWVAYLFETDHDDADLAARNLEMCLARFGIASLEFRRLLLVEAAIFQAWFRDDEEKAKVWSRKAGSSPAVSLMEQLRLAICLAWVGRRYDDLNAAWEKGRAYIETLPSSPTKENLKDGWLEWKDEIDKKRARRAAQSPV